MTLPALLLVAVLNPGPQQPAATPAPEAAAPQPVRAPAAEPAAQAPAPAAPTAPRSSGRTATRRGRARTPAHPAAAAEPAGEAQPPAGGEPAAASAAPGSAEEHIQAGLAAFRKRRFASARTHFEEAVAADPNSPAAHFYLGYTIYKIAEPHRPFHPDKQKAADQFAKAYELDPGFKPVWHR